MQNAQPGLTALAQSWIWGEARTRTSEQIRRPEVKSWVAGHGQGRHRPRSASKPSGLIREGSPAFVCTRAPLGCNQLQKVDTNILVCTYLHQEYVKVRLTYVRCTSLYVPYARTKVKSTSGTTTTSIATPVRPYHVQILRAPTLIGSRLHEVDT